MFPTLTQIIFLSLDVTTIRSQNTWASLGAKSEEDIHNIIQSLPVQSFLFLNYDMSNCRLCGRSVRFMIVGSEKSIIVNSRTSKNHGRPMKTRMRLMMEGKHLMRKEVKLGR